MTRSGGSSAPEGSRSVAVRHRRVVSCTVTMVGHSRTAAESGGWSLSAEEAERFAARIRPSWEIGDDADVAPPGMKEARAAASASAPAPPPATTAAGTNGGDDGPIVGIPTIPVEAAPASGPRARTDAEVERWGSGSPDGALRPTPQVEGTPGAGGDHAPHEPQPAEAKPDRTAERPDSEPAKTNGAAARAVEPPPAPAQASESSAETRRPRGQPRKASEPLGKAKATPGGSRAAPDGDSIELPVTGAGKGTLLKVGLAAAALVALVLGGRAMIGPRGGDQRATPEPTAHPAEPPRPAEPPGPAPAPEPPAAAAATAQAAPSPPPAQAPSTAAAPTAPSAAAAAPATAPRKPVEAPAPAPVAAATPTATAKATATKPPAGPAQPGGSQPSSGGKTGGGIIRDTPF
jgi:hypothetical protein